MSSPPSKSARAAAAMRRVLDLDSDLGTIRNHASESSSLAETVRAYVSGLDAIDFTGCPEDFTAAFGRHRDAWQRSIPTFERHDRLRGEMHDLFDEIRALGSDERMELEGIEKEIWGTWREVEAAVARHDGGRE